MIRINLLAAERTGQKKKAPSAAPGALQAYIFLALFGGGALVVCGFLWWLKSSSIESLANEIAQTQKRQQELQAIKAKVDEYENQKRMLDAKISLIEKLQAEQSGPVHMLDEISRALPDFVWLTSMDQTAAAIRLKGESNGLTSVADLITNLQRAGAPACAELAGQGRQADRSLCYFGKVELVSSTEANGIVTFEVSAAFSNVSKQIKAAASGAPAGASPAAAPAAADPKQP